MDRGPSSASHIHIHDQLSWVLYHADVAVDALDIDCLHRPMHYIQALHMDVVRVVASTLPIDWLNETTRCQLWRDVEHAQRKDNQSQDG